MVEIVFMDAGETILHPHPSFPELFARVVSNERRQVTPEEVAAVQERLAPHLVELAHETGIEAPSLNPKDSRVFWSHLYRSFLTALDIQDEELVGALYDTFSDSSSYRLYDDALPALTELKDRGFRLGLISNFEAWLEEMLVELEVGHIFDVAVISGIAGVEKPDPEIYRIALAQANVEPRLSVHVGDSPSMDVRPAQSVGMHTLLLDRFGRYPDQESRIETLDDLPDAVQSL